MWLPGAACMRRSVAAAIFAAACAAATPCGAQDDAASRRLTELTLEELGEIRVTSVSKQPDEAWRTPVAIHVITADDIRRSGATNLPDVLRLAPGVAVARIDSDHWAIGIRGFGDQFSKSLLVLIDGRSLYTPLFAGIYWAANDVMLEDVERIEVIRGPGGTIWGGNAVSGLINIITKRTADTQGALATVGAGSVDRGIAAVRYGSRSGAALNYRVYAKAFSRDPLSHPDGADYDAWWMGQSGFRADWTPRAGDTFTFQGDASGGRHGQQVSVGQFSPPANVTLSTPANVSGGNLNLTWRRQLKAGNELRVQAYYDRTAWQAPHFSETRNTVDLDLVHGFALGRRQRLSWGAGAHWSPGDFEQTVPSLDFSPRSEANHYYSAFGQDEIQLLPQRLTLTAGTKFEHNSYTGLELQPNARLMWTAGERHALWTAVSGAVRTPSRIERGIRLSSFNSMLTLPSGVAVPVFLEIDGSSAFTSEQLVGYEAGYRTLAVPRLYMDLTEFHHDWDDLASFGRGATTVDMAPAPPHVVVHLPYVNGVEGNVNGFEIAPDWRPAPWAQITGSYSFLSLDLRQKPVSVDPNGIARYEGSSPRHQGRIAAHVALPRSTEFDVTYRAVSALPAQQAPGYGTADLRLSWMARPGLELALDGRNLFAPDHVEFLHTPPPAAGVPRSVFASVTWSRRPASRP